MYQNISKILKKFNSIFKFPKEIHTKNNSSFTHILSQKVVKENFFQKLPKFVRNIKTLPETESMKPMFFLWSKVVMGDPLLGGLIAPDLPDDNPHHLFLKGWEETLFYFHFPKTSRVPTLLSTKQGDLKLPWMKFPSHKSDKRIRMENWE